MKKITVILIAALFGLAMASCDTTPKETPHDKIMKKCNDFFAGIEKELDDIKDGKEFMEHFEGLEQRKNDFVFDMYADYLDKDGNLVGITEEEHEKIESEVYERATKYNQVESEKFAEFFEPDIIKYEEILNVVYDKLQNGEVPSVEELDTYLAASDRIAMYETYDNVPLRYQEKMQNMAEKIYFVQDLLFSEDE